jgi:WD40 repeat protein/uncharacterized protein YndB with AHSA1/START domain
MLEPCPPGKGDCCRTLGSLGATLIALAASSQLRAIEETPKNSGEVRILRKEVVVEAPVDVVWHAWTTEDGIASFFSPGSKIELDLGGAYEIYMGMEEPDESGRRGSEGCKLLSFIPRQMLAFEWSFPPKVMTLRKADAKTQVVLLFDAIDAGKTRVRFAQLGWKNGEDWDAGYAYFDKAWSHVMSQLQSTLRGKASDTPEGPIAKFWQDGHVKVSSASTPLKSQSFQMTIPATLKETWDILATTAGLRKLGGKDSTVELVPGGRYAFWPKSNNRVLAYLPGGMLSTSGSAPPKFPNVQKGGTWSAYFFEKIDDKTTRLRLTCIGWRPGEKEWDDAFDYFLKANAQFLNSVYEKLAGEQKSDAGDVLRHECIVDAPVADVWAALTTKEGVESWMVAHAQIDLRVGGKMLTHYSREGELGDPNTIENTILSFEPERMISIKATKPPASFPMKEAIKGMWSVIRLEPVSERQTRVICTGMGYGDDEESKKMRQHFDRGNAWTLGKLQERFRIAGKKPAAPPDAASEAEVQSYAAHMAAAEATFRLNELAEARRWIESAAPPLRNWEWRHVRAALDDSLRTIDGRSGGLMSIAASGDGKRLVTGGNDGLVRVWDAATGNELATMKGHGGAVFCVAFSPDGKRVASSSADRTARVWDTDSGEQVLIYKGHKNPVPFVAFSPDGKRIASCCYEFLSSSPMKLDGQAHLWDPSATVEATTELKLTGGGDKPISSLAWSPDGSKLVAGSWNGHVYIWELSGDPAAPADVEFPEAGLYNAVNAVAVSPDGRIFAAGSKDRTARIWKLKSKKSVATLRGHDDFVNALRFSPDGTKLATGGGDDCVRLWDVDTWKETAVLRGHHQDVQSVCWVDGENTLATASLDGTVRTWDATYPHYGGMKMAQSAACYAALFSPDGRRLFSCGYDGSISIWDTGTGDAIANWSAHPGASTNTLSLSADGKRLLSVSWDKSAKVWDTRTNEEIATLAHDQGIYHGAISPDGRRAVCTQKSVATVWDVDRQQVLHKLEGHEGGISSTAFSSDGSMICTSGGDKTVRTWEADTGTPIAVMKGHEGGIESAVFSPDGALVASGSADGSVRLWNARSGELIRMLYDGDDTIYRVAFSPDGSRVAVGGNRTLLLDTAHGGLVGAFRANPDGAWHLSFSPDGTRLATAGWDKSIRILDTRPVRELIARPEKQAALNQPKGP